jgi:glutamate dehydrogenase
MSRHPLKREIIATHVVNSMINRVGSTFVHRLLETAGAKPHEVVRAYLLTREIFDFVPLWQAIEVLDNEVDDAVQAAILIDISRLLGRGTAWFLRSRRLGLDMVATIAHFAPRVEALGKRLPQLQGTGDRGPADAALARYTEEGVPAELAQRVVAFDMLYAALDIVEVAGSTQRPVETVAEIYADLATRLGLPWLREKIGSLPGEGHWPMLAKGAMQDDLSGMQRTIATEIIAEGPASAATPALIAAWRDRNARSIERAARLLSELRAAPSPDAAMIAVALRELRNLA